MPKTVETRRHCEEDLEHATIFRNPQKPHFFSHKYGKDTYIPVGIARTCLSDWLGTRYNAGGEEGTYYCACAIRTKWRLGHLETPVELSVSQTRFVLESIGV